MEISVFFGRLRFPAAAAGAEIGMLLCARAALPVLGRGTGTLVAAVFARRALPLFAAVGTLPLFRARGLLRRFSEVHEAGVTSLCFNASGQQICSASYDGTVR